MTAAQADIKSEVKRIYFDFLDQGYSPKEAMDMAHAIGNRAQRVVEAADTPKPQTVPLSIPTVGSKSRIVGVFALLIGIPFWLEAARFTRDGWIAFLNWLCDRFSIPWQVPILPWYVMLALIALLGFGYSYVEIIKQPIRTPRDWRKNFFAWSQWRFERRWEAWLVWIVLIVSDVGTTYAGARNPDPSGLTIMRDIAAATAPLALYATILTFLPDRLVRFGWRTLRG